MASVTLCCLRLVIHMGPFFFSCVLQSTALISPPPRCLRHNSVALDLCVSAAPQGTYTLMGPELDADGWVKDPIRLEWASGACFVTPPGWWHSHHNDTDQDAWVLPLQDAGLHTHMRTLKIEFSTAEKGAEDSTASSTSSVESDKTTAALTSP